MCGEGVEGGTYYLSKIVDKEGDDEKVVVSDLNLNEISNTIKHCKTHLICMFALTHEFSLYEYFSSEEVIIVQLVIVALSFCEHFLKL